MRCYVAQIILLLSVACSPIEHVVIQLPEHFKLLGSELKVEAGEHSGLLRIYNVAWRGESLLPLGYSYWSGQVNARNGPGAALLIRLYPDGTLPRDLNAELIIQKIADMERPWLLEAQWLEDSILSGNLSNLSSYFSSPRNIFFNFGDDTWISTDPLDEKLYQVPINLKMYAGEHRMYIGMNTGQIRILHLARDGTFIALDRSARGE